MPVIADVDNDGNAEVIIAENENNGGTPGVEVWRDEDDNWVRSRRIWNQHSYHISNISEDGVVPTYESPNWLSGQNNFRQNVQAEGVFYAPDLFVASIEVQCGDELTVVACIGNQGALRVPDGVWVTLNLTVGGESVTLEPAATDAAVEPRGACVEVSFTFVPPGAVWTGDPFTVTVETDVDGTVNGAHNECDEGNNVLTSDDICPA